MIKLDNVCSNLSRVALVDDEVELMLVLEVVEPLAAFASGGGGDGGAD